MRRPSSAADIPDDVSVAKMDPDNRRASAKVNGEIITGTDVEQRVALIVAANEGVEISDEEMQRLRQQVMRNLIDETLEIQEAAAQDMAVTKQEVDEYYLRYAAQRFGRTPEKLDEYLKSVGSSPASLKRQIEGELAWDRLLQRNVRPFVNVSAEEVNELYQRLQAAKGTPEYKLSRNLPVFHPGDARGGGRERQADRRTASPGRQLSRLRAAVFRSLDRRGGRRSRLDQARAAAEPDAGNRGAQHAARPACRTDRDSGRLFDPLPAGQAPGRHGRSARRGAQPEADFARISQGDERGRSQGARQRPLPRRRAR